MLHSYGQIAGHGHRSHGCDRAAQKTTISNKMNKAKTAIAAFLAGFVFLGMLQYQAAWLESQPIC